MTDLCVCGRPQYSAVKPKNAQAMVLYSRLDDEAYFRIEGNELPSPASDRILKTELKRVGLDFDQLARDVLWKHAPNTLCGLTMVELLYRSLAYPVTLIVGSELSTSLVGHAVAGVNGLVFASPFFAGGVLIPCLHPSMLATGRGLGEVRFALTQFAAQIKDKGVQEHAIGRRKRSRT